MDVPDGNPEREAHDEGQLGGGPQAFEPNGPWIFGTYHGTVETFFVDATGDRLTLGGGLPAKTPLGLL